MTGGFGRIYRGETRIDFIGRRRLWFAISGLIVGVCVVTLLVNRLNFGIEFVGGVTINAPVPATGPLGDTDDAEVIATVRDAVARFGADEAQIQIASDGDERLVSVQSKEVAEAERQEEVVAAVAETVGAERADVTSERIGNKWGEEITDKAIRALVVFMVVVFAFISWRFEWKMAVAALVALVHDMLITAGIYSLVGFEVTPSTIIALLTILGYSLYDTVVVFDKVEEDTAMLAGTGKATYQDAANLAMNEVFMRSLNTSLSTLLPVAALLFVGAGLLGAATLKDLSLALFVGIMIGSYSSIFVATPVLSVWKEREPRYRNVREKVLRDAKRRAAVPAGPLVSADGELEPAPAVASSPRVTSTKARVTSKPRAGTKKAKRRKRR